MISTDKLQHELCTKYNAVFFSSPRDLKLGIANIACEIEWPINGFRHPPARGTTGWYIYGGEKFSEDSDFFKPLHVEHLDKRCPVVIKYLGLPPGWRFLLDEDYVDVWYDKSLCDID